MLVLRIAARAFAALPLVIGAIAPKWSGVLVAAGLVPAALAVRLLITRRARWGFAAGAAPPRAGEPGHGRELDRAGDGVACEA